PVDEALHFLASFAMRIKVLEKGSYSILVEALDPEEGWKLRYFTVIEENGVVSAISVGNLGNFSLSRILQTHGQPAEVRIWAVSSISLYPMARFTLHLFYPDQGIYVIYAGETNKEEPLKICPANFTFHGNGGLVLWSPLEQKTFEDIGEINPLSDLTYSLIEEATNFSVETFYETYKDPANQSVCFEMPDPDLVSNP
ncbi:MAG: hypothetical protein OEZ02_09555, partial [Anaerolineae bacterium]|nr:hypothetical protein [Anaerolineae bacterium]